MAPLTLHLFGAFQVTLADGSTARFESDKTCALLVYLVVEADRPHRRDALVGLLWPDEPEQSARHNLRQALFNLRQTIGDAAAQPPYLLINRDEIQFNTASDFALDAATFDTHLAACAGHPHTSLQACAVCALHLRQAVDLYYGRFLQEFFLGDSAEFEEWAVARREAWHQRALDALSDLADYYEQHGNLAETRHCALRLLELDPWHEPAHRQLMRVFALEGQRGAAIAQYEKCRRVLAEELGVEPSGETRELYEQIRVRNWTNRLEAGLRNEAPHPISQLPAQLTPFIGREQELADLGRLIADPACRCITLVGPGGIGKTRLALQAASNVRHDLVQNVTFVPLVTIESVEAVVPAIADALGLSFYGPASPRLQLLNYLRDKQMLLVLDNVEQLLAEDPLQPSAAELFIEILQRADIKLLLTSREPLNVQGEWVLEVGGLQIPEDDRTEAIESSAAVALFLQRAQRARVSFALRTEDRPGVVQLCRLVGGTPLALELAATWVRTLSVPEIVKEIEQNLDFLSASLRDLPERHRSMRAVFDRSWEMLTAEEQSVLAELSVFHGRFQRQAAEQVAGASLAMLSALVAKSLVRRTDTGHYDLHELVRQYAAARLAERPSAQSVAERHSRYYLDWLGQSAAHLKDHRQKATVSELAAEVDNLRAAWDWAITYGDIPRACQVSTALWHLFELRSWFAEGETLFRNAAEAIQARGALTGSGADELIAVHAMCAHSANFSFRLGKATAAYAVLLPSARHLQSSKDQFAAMYALLYLGITCWELGRFAEAKENLQASLEKARACGERWWMTLAREFLGIVAHATGDYEEARRHLLEALASARETGDPKLIAHVLVSFSQTIVTMGQTAEAGESLRESLSLAQEIGYRHVIGRALDGLGQLAQATSPDEARTLFAASCAVFRETGELALLSVVLGHQADNALSMGDVGAAHDSFVEMLRLAHEGGYKPFALDALAGLAMMWAKDTNPERALGLVAQVLKHPAASQTAKSRAERLRAELESRLTPDQIRAARAQAEGDSYDQIVSQVLRLGISAPSVP